MFVHLNKLWYRFLVGYVIYSLVASNFHTLEIAPDSVRYLPPVKFLDKHQPGILTALLYRICNGEHRLILLLQVVAATASWAYLADVLRRRIKGRLGVFIGAGVLLYSLVPPLLIWQWFALSDGLALSFVILWIATCLDISNNHHLCRRFVLTLNFIAFILALTTRPQLLVVVVPIQVLIFVRLYQLLTRSVFVLNALLSAVVTLWSSVRLIVITHLGYLQIWYAQNNLVNKPGYRRWVLENFENCRGARHAFSTYATAREYSVSTTCSGLREWLMSTDSNFMAWFRAKPSDALVEFFRDLRKTSFGFYADYSSQRGVLPLHWTEIILPTQISVMNLMSLYVLAGVLMIGHRSNVRISFTRVLTGLTVIFSAFTYMFITWGSDGMETSRHMFPILGLLPLASVVIPIVFFKSDVPNNK